MNLADIAIRRPTFITCVVLLMLAVGGLAMSRLGVDMFPDITIPVVTVTTPYPGAGPAEVETLISKVLEDEISSIAGIKRLSSINYEGLSRVVAEFTYETDVKYAENQIRDRVSAAKRKLPQDIKEPTIRRIDFADLPIMSLSLDANLPEAQLFDLANEEIRPRLEQVNQVGLVEVVGARKREIQVLLDQDKLKKHELTAAMVASRLSAAGENVPSGKVERGKSETVIRSLGEFRKISDIKSTIVNFFGSDIPTTINDVGTVDDTLEDENSRVTVNGKRSLVLNVFRQSGANTIQVVNAIKAKTDALNKEFGALPGSPKLTVVRDGGFAIRINVADVKESIIFGVLLAVLVVFFFLGNTRSTIITGLALPNSLIGAFILIAMAGFTINIMTLLALSLSVGLLIDDAIVVRENIFRHIEMGKTPKEAALQGTNEVRLAVIATTLTVIAVFGPVAFLKGVVGQFFRQFGATICFAMAISLFDALTMAPMLSAYFAGTHETTKTTGLWGATIGKSLLAFDRFQNWLTNYYERVLRYTLKHPLKVLSASVLIFVLSVGTVVFVPKTFMPTQDNGEFSVNLDLPPGTNLSAMHDVAVKVDEMIRSNPEIEISQLTTGGRNGESNTAQFYIRLVDSKLRKLNTSQVKEKLREQLKGFTYANPRVTDYDPLGGGKSQFVLNVLGNDQDELERVAKDLFALAKQQKGLKDVDISYRPGMPEFQTAIDKEKAKLMGVSTKTAGYELRAQVEGLVATKFRELGREYDVRVRMKEDQRNIKDRFDRTYVPNINNNLVRLSDVAHPVSTQGPATINRQDRSRYISITAEIAPGAGISNIMKEMNAKIASQIKIPQGIRYSYLGQAETFTELADSVVIAVLLGMLFIFLVLASLYESFVTPLTIMLALPLAVCGSFVALAAVHETLNVFSVIGVIMLLGIATKNSILLVDYANQQIQNGMDKADAIIRAGKTRLRPILMTTMALIAGTLPVALGLNEASRQRTSMGVAIIGGLISSTILTLVVVPAAFSYIDRFRVWSRNKMAKVFLSKSQQKASQKELAENS